MRKLLQTCSSQELLFCRTLLEDCSKKKKKKKEKKKGPAKSWVHVKQTQRQTFPLRSGYLLMCLIITITITHSAEIFFKALHWCIFSARRCQGQADQWKAQTDMKCVQRDCLSTKTNRSLLMSYSAPRMFAAVCVCVGMHNLVVFFPGHDHTPSGLSSGHHNLIPPSLLSKLISALLRETGPDCCWSLWRMCYCLVPTVSLLFWTNLQRRETDSSRRELSFRGEWKKCITTSIACETLYGVHNIPQMSVCVFHYVAILPETWHRGQNQ